MKFIFKKLQENLEKATPYMLRNDGVLFKCDRYHPYISNIYNDEDDLKSLVNERIEELLWFYENTNYEDTKEDIKIIVKSLCDFGENYLCTTEYLIDKFDITDNIYVCYDIKETIDFLHELNDLTNQEFCKVRTSNVKYGGNNNDIYFRISSIGFNWFNLIWDLVYENKNQIETVTISKDGRVRDFSLGDCYKINGKEINHISTDDFITLKGNPVIEKFKSNLIAINEANEKLYLGKSLKEAYPNLHPRDVVGFYNKQKKEQLNWDLNNILR